MMSVSPQLTERLSGILLEQGVMLVAVSGRILIDLLPDEVFFAARECALRVTQAVWEFENRRRVS